VILYFLPLLSIDSALGQASSPLDLCILLSYPKRDQVRKKFPMISFLETIYARKLVFSRRAEGFFSFFRNKAPQGPARFCVDPRNPSAKTPLTRPDCSVVESLFPFVERFTSFGFFGRRKRRPLIVRMLVSQACPRDPDSRLRGQSGPFNRSPVVPSWVLYALYCTYISCRCRGRMAREPPPDFLIGARHPPLYARWRSFNSFPGAHIGVTYS